MSKTLDEILRGGQVDPAALRAMQEAAKKAGLTKRVIHLELDMLTGNMTYDASPMDLVSKLGMIEFFKTTVVAEVLKRPISKTEEPEQKPEATAPVDSVPR